MSKDTNSNALRIPEKVYILWKCVTGKIGSDYPIWTGWLHQGYSIYIYIYIYIFTHTHTHTNINMSSAIWKHVCYVVMMIQYYRIFRFPKHIGNPDFYLKCVHV
jgi:hypothetical protein